MQILGSFKAEDVEDDAPKYDYSLFKSRKAARAIVFDGDKVALIQIHNHDYYMLPGGGIEEEGIIAGLSREIMEELGCNVKITGEVGSAEVYFGRWGTKQIDYCYTAKKFGINTGTSLTDFEKEEGHKVIWASSLSKAIRLLEDAKPLNLEGKLVQARDLLFLKSI